MRKPIWRRIVLYLARRDGRRPVKLGTIMRALNLPEGTATHQRITDAKERGWKIKCHKDDGYAYSMPSWQCRKAIEMGQRGRL